MWRLWKTGFRRCFVNNMFLQVWKIWNSMDESIQVSPTWICYGVSTYVLLWRRRGKLWIWDWLAADVLGNTSSQVCGSCWLWMSVNVITTLLSWRIQLPGSSSRESYSSFFWGLSWWHQNSRYIVLLILLLLILKS